MFARSLIAILSVTAFSVASANAGENNGESWFSGDWYLTLGATGMRAPSFEGSKDYLFRASPVISLGKAGKAARFVSRNDGISLSLIDRGPFRAGLNGEILFGRESKDQLAGLDPVRFGGEIGGFAEFYPTDWLRVRGEVRHGIRTHDGIVADLTADAFYDITPQVRISGGPRATFATSGYFETYYGVNATEAAASGLTAYAPEGGMKSAGAGGAVTWKVTDALTTSAFAEYAKLTGPAADSSLVKERGSENQFTVGLTLTYRFDFSL